MNMKKFLYVITIACLIVGSQQCCEKNTPECEKYIGKTMYLHDGPFKFCKVRILGCLGHISPDIIASLQGVAANDTRTGILTKIFQKTFPDRKKDKVAYRAFKQAVIALQPTIEKYHRWFYDPKHIQGKNWMWTSDHSPIYYGTICDSTHFCTTLQYKLRYNNNASFAPKIIDPMNETVCFGSHWLMDPSYQS
jgi:hypothetical protein